MSVEKRARALLGGKRRVSKKKRASEARVSKKIKILRAEGVPEKQAVAEALSMERAGRIRNNGSYSRVKKRKKKQS